MVVKVEYLASELAGEARVYSRLVLRQWGAHFGGWLFPLSRPGARTLHVRGHFLDDDRMSLSLRANRGVDTRVARYRLQRAPEGRAWSSIPPAASTAVNAVVHCALEACRGYVIAPSRTHGHGVIATRDFQAGEEIAVLRGAIGPEQTRWSARLTDTLHLEPWGMLRFLNHCCEANAKIDASDPQRPVLRAAGAIGCGEEINFDYIENEGEIVGGFDCGCPAKRHHVQADR